MLASRAILLLRQIGWHASGPQGTQNTRVLWGEARMHTRERERELAWGLIKDCCWVLHLLIDLAVTHKVASSFPGCHHACIIYYLTCSILSIDAPVSVT